MELEARRVVSSDHGFVAIPLNLIYLLQQNDSGISSLPVLELSISNSAVSWFVAWAGATSTSSSIEVPEKLAECIGLPDQARVKVRVRVDVPNAEKVLVEPASEDDSEILELHADYLESHILNKVGVVQEGRQFPVSVPGQGLVVLLAKSTAPRSVVKLVQGTELVVSVKRRQPRRSSAPQLGREIWLRVQELDGSLYRTCKFGSKEVNIIPTASVYVSSSTARKVGLESGQWVLLKARSHNAHKSLETSSGTETVTWSTILRLIVWDEVAEGHVMISWPLRAFVNVRLHAGVFLQSFESVSTEHAEVAKVSPLVCRPAKELRTDKSKDGEEIEKRNLSRNEELSDKELMHAAGTVSSILFKLWLEAQSELLPDDDQKKTAITLPVEGIVSIAEACPDCEQQPRNSHYIVNLEGGGGARGYLFQVDVAQLDQERSINDQGSNLTKVQLGGPRYLYKHDETEFNAAPFGSVWLKGIADKALKRLSLLLSPARRQNLRAFGTPTPSGVLLHGPPACGKTQLALTLARKLNEDKEILAHWVYIKCSELVGEAHDSTKHRLKDCVLEAIHHAPSLVVFDELDVFLSVNEGATAEVSTTAQAEYVSDLIDIAKETGCVAFLATASRPNALPTPLRSAGRFDYAIELGPPGISERADILRELIVARGFCCSGDSTTKVCAGLEGYDANDLELVVDRAIHASAARFLKSKGKKVITEKDLDAALQGFVPGALKGVAKASTSGSKLGWDDIGGLPEVCRVLRELLELPVKYPKVFASAPLRLRTGVLLYGPPGCGKTHVVAAAAAACSLRYIPVKGPELLDKYIGSSEQAVRDVFARAAAASPCILFFDEFDAIAPKRGHDNTGVTDRVVNQLLAELDGVSALTGVFTFAATNRPDLIDAALLRPGRLDHLLFCDFPSESERLDILRVLSRHLPVDKDVDLEYLSRYSEGFSGADLKAVLSDAELEAVHLAIERSDKNNVERPLITMDILKGTLAKAAPLQESERRRFTNIYNTFTSGRSSNKDRKGKKATLA